MPNRPLRLLHLTDTHLLGTAEGLLRGSAPLATLRQVQTHAARHFPKPDGTLLTGDLVQDDAAGYPLVRAAFAHHTAPVYCLPGNHDIPEALLATLNGAPFVTALHTQLGAWQLILLNTWQRNQAGGKLGEVQLQQLDALLRAHRDQHALVCLHHQPIAMGSDWLDQVGLKDAEAFRACIGQHQQVRGVLWGHVHQALDKTREHVRYMATPATCVQFLPGSSDFALDTRPPGYRTLVLHDDGRIDTDVVWVPSA